MLGGVRGAPVGIMAHRPPTRLATLKRPYKGKALSLLINPEKKIPATSPLKTNIYAYPDGVFRYACCVLFGKAYDRQSLTA